MKPSKPRVRLVISYLLFSLLIGALGFAAESADHAAKKKAGRKAKAATESATTGAGFTAAVAGAEAPTFPTRPTAVGPVVGENKATPVSRFKVPAGFKVELIYSVPGATQAQVLSGMR